MPINGEDRAINSPDMVSILHHKTVPLSPGTKILEKYVAKTNVLTTTGQGLHAQSDRHHAEIAFLFIIRFSQSKHLSMPISVNSYFEIFSW